MSTSSRRCRVLTNALRVLENIAPLKLAAPWDNVGVLIDATAMHSGGIYKIFLTNDLTPPVLREAVEIHANLVVTYHPTPFASMKRFESSNPAANVVLTAAREGFAVYSPHTALDSVPGGINDWLITSIVQHAWGDHAASCVFAPVKPCADATWSARGAGDGRIATSLPPLPLSSVVAAIKAVLELPTVQLALPANMLSITKAGADDVMSAAGSHDVTSIAVCAGSGSSILAGCAAGVLLTGEMGHHEVISATVAGCSVVLTNHSNCERGFLPRLKSRIIAEWEVASKVASNSGDAGLPLLEVHISDIDADPLVTV